MAAERTLGRWPACPRPAGGRALCEGWGVEVEKGEGAERCEEKGPSGFDEGEAATGQRRGKEG